MQADAARPPALHCTAQPLNDRDFAPYGWMLDIEQAFAGNTGRAINAGTSRRADLPGTLSLTAQGGEPLATVFRARAQLPHGPWRLLERHGLGTQTFVPMRPSDARGAVCVLLVALGADAPDMTTLRAFTVHAHQAFTLKPGTWHHPLIALHDSDFLVIERRAAQEDCEIQHLQQAVHVRVEGHSVQV